MAGRVLDSVLALRRAGPLPGLLLGRLAASALGADRKLRALGERDELGALAGAVGDLLHLLTVVLLDVAGERQVAVLDDLVLTLDGEPGEEDRVRDVHLAGGEQLLTLRAEVEQLEPVADPGLGAVELLRDLLRLELRGVGVAVDGLGLLHRGEVEADQVLLELYLGDAQVVELQDPHGDDLELEPLRGGEAPVASDQLVDGAGLRGVDVHVPVRVAAYDRGLQHPDPPDGRDELLEGGAVLVHLPDVRPQGDVGDGELNGRCFRRHDVPHMNCEEPLRKGRKGLGVRVREAAPCRLSARSARTSAWPPPPGSGSRSGRSRPGR